MKKKSIKSVRFTLAYVLFCVVFMASSVGLSVLAEGNIPLADLENKELPGEAEDNAASEDKSKPFLLMIDPGHGGEDGGAVGDGGILEKDLNLSVSENIADLSLLFGLPYSMTREDDTLLYDKYDELSDYTGKKKSLDLRNRLRASEEEGASVFLSIHMNKFTSPAYSGLQVYYSPNCDGGRVLAEAIRAYNCSHLQRDNEREIKPATSSIYLLHRLQIPSVLVECGFLSNPSECSMLADAQYRSSLACTVFTPVLEYCVRSTAD